MISLPCTGCGRILPFHPKRWHSVRPQRYEAVRMNPSLVLFLGPTLGSCLKERSSRCTLSWFCFALDHTPNMHPLRSLFFLVAADRFLEHNKLRLVVRSHECVDEGIRVRPTTNPVPLSPSSYSPAPRPTCYTLLASIAVSLACFLVPCARLQRFPALSTERISGKREAIW